MSVLIVRYVCLSLHPRGFGTICKCSCCLSRSWSRICCTCLQGHGKRFEGSESSRCHSRIDLIQDYTSLTQSPLGRPSLKGSKMGTISIQVTTTSTPGTYSSSLASCTAQFSCHCRSRLRMRRASSSKFERDEEKSRRAKCSSALQFRALVTYIIFVEFPWTLLSTISSSSTFSSSFVRDTTIGAKSSSTTSARSPMSSYGIDMATSM